jgi:Zn-dependent protease with chaperone function
VAVPDLSAVSYLIPILLSLASLALGDLGLETGWKMPALVPLCALLPWLAGHAEARAGIAGRFRAAALLHRLAPALPVLGQYLAIGVLGWATSIEEWLGGELSLLSWPRPAQLLALAPYVLYTLGAIDAEARANTEHGPVRRSLRGFQSRMFLTGILPVAAYILLASFLGEWTALRVRVEEVALVSAGFTALMVVVLVRFLPLLLRSIWETEPLPEGPELVLLQQVARLAGFRCRELLLWRTGNLMANAAIVGVTGGSRRVFLSDALISRLGPRQLAAVFAHEIGHARRHHIPLFLIWALGFFAALDLLALEIDPAWDSWGVPILVAGLFVWLLGFGWLSRRVELDADLYSLELLRDGIGITSALLAVTRGQRDRGGWRHFSVSRRIEFLGRAASDPTAGNSLRRRLAFAWATGTLLFLVAGGMQVSGFLGGYGEEMIGVELRLGRYESAAMRLRSVSAPSEEVTLLVELASSTLGGDFPTPEEAAAECLGRAEEALSRGEVDLGNAWRHLASLAGADHDALQLGR